MILADKIINERKKNGWSQEELAEKLNVSRQAVSKWEGAQSIPDLQRIVAMAELFGVSTDYLLKDEIEAAVPSTCEEPFTADETPLHRVTMQEAHAFLDMKRQSAVKIANATAMCIVSPALLIFASAMAEYKIWNMSAELAAGIGLLVLFGFVAAAVYIFITNGIRDSRMEHLEKESFETEYGVTGMVREKRSAYEPAYTRGIALGVVLCIVAVIPLIVGALAGAADYVCASLVSLLLIIVAAGVNMIIRVSTVKGSFDTLLQEGDYSRAEKKARKKLDTFDTVYWCTATAIYLGWSFWTSRWDFTWLVWPVAGVLYAAVFAILRLVVDTKNK